MLNNYLPAIIHNLKILKYRFAVIFVFITCYGFINNLNAQQSGDIELSSINFEGNVEFSDAELKGIIRNKETPFWFWKLLDSFTPFGSSPAYFDSTAISVDLIALKSFYSVNGFFMADFSYSFKIDSSSRTASLTYFINEGKPFTYGRILLFGLDSLNEGLKRLINPYTSLAANERFNQAKIARQMSIVLGILHNNGYMLASFDSTLITIDSVRYKTDMNIYFTTGHKFKYNEIRVEKSGVGQNLVSNNLIKYVANIHVGETYNDNELSKSRLRLARTGLFNAINLKGVVNDTTGNMVPLLISGNIGPLNELAPEVFIDNEFNTSNVGIGLNYIRKNFFGDARKLTLSTRFKLNDIGQFRFSSRSAKDSTFQTQLDISLSLEQPFLFSRNVSGSLEGFLKNYNISTTQFDNYGGKILLGIDMPRHTFINLLNPYLRLDALIFDLDYNIIDIPLIVERSTTTAIIGSEIGSTTANNIFFPSAGYNLNFVLELATSNNTFTGSGQTIMDSLGVPETRQTDLGLYYKIDAILANYISLSRDNFTVLGIKFRLGYIQPFKGGLELISPNQTFFAGGANSVRGWRARQLVPENEIEFIGLTKPVENNIRGGTFILEGSFEFRRKFNPDFGYTIFLDYGNTWNGYTEFSISEVAAALGFGFRYYSPFAPFRFDLGWKLWDPQNDITLFQRPFWKAFEFHFGIGEAF